MLEFMTMVSMGYIFIFVVIAIGGYAKYTNLKALKIYNEARRLHLEYLRLVAEKEFKSVLSDERRYHDNKTELARQMAVKKIKEYEIYSGNIFTI